MAYRSKSFTPHPRKSRASKGMEREGRDWEREKRREEGRGRETPLARCETEALGPARFN